MSFILEVKNLTKDFCSQRKKIFRALDNLSFSLHNGQILAVLGPNGAGKTTLLKVIATLIMPNKGSILINGTNNEEKIKSYIGLVSDEERSFYWRLSGRQNLEFFAALYGLDKRQTQNRINELLQLFKVDYQEKRFDSYSTGMKRRFALMRALIHNPELLLLDEPFRSLDYNTTFLLRNFIQENLVKKEGKTVIFTTHHTDEVLGYADLFMFLHQGKILDWGEPCLERLSLLSKKTF